jgi:basic membrane lipoprotein Med (substrate-binding protein (PBP1-ABC) superfamily)
MFMLLIAACNRPETAERPDAAARRPEPSAQRGPPVAHFLFVIPPPDPKYPEREVFTPAFSQAAKDAFAAANWEYREIRLYEKPTTEWISIMRQELDSYPTVVFSYHDTYTYLFVKLSETFEVRPANYVLALASIPPEASSLFFRMDFRMEEPGYIAGAALAHLSRTGRIAVLSFEEEWCDRFVAGFTQGVREVRAGSSVTDLRVKRKELVAPEEGLELIWGMLDKVKQHSMSGLGVDAVAVLASGLGESFITSLEGSSSYAIAGITPPPDEAYRSVVFSSVVDFGQLPLFFVKNADDIGLFRIDEPVKLNEGAKDSLYVPKPGRSVPTGGVKVITIGLRDDVIKLVGLTGYESFSRLPDEVKTEITYYERAIKAGEIPISAKPLTD